MDAAAVEQALRAMQAQLQQQAAQLQQHQQAAAAAVAAAAHAPAAPARPRAKIPSASSYSGSPSLLDSWLREMRQQFEWYTCTADAEQVAMAAVHLKGVALDWWCSQLSAAEQFALRASYAAFELALRTRFQPVNSAQTARLALDSLRQGARQSVQDYTSAFRRLLVSVPDMCEADKVHRFVQGLRGPAQAHLIVHDCDTLDKAIGMAARVGSLTLYAASSAAASGGSPMDLNAMHGGSADTEPPASDDDNDIPVTRSEFKQLLAAMQAQRSGSARGREGHRPAFGGRGDRGRGPPRVQGLSEQEVRRRLDESLCFICGQPGHRKFDCPQKKEKSFP